MRNFFTLLFIASLLFGCNSDRPSEKYGHSIKMCLESEPSTYTSYEVSDFYSASFISQIMEGLMSIDPKTLKVVNQLASDYKVNNDGTVYTFTIRKDVYFHPHDVFKSDNDRLLTAEDVVATFEAICSPTKNGMESIAYGHLLKGILKGATEFHENKTKKIAGIKANGNQVEITLTQKDDNFLYKLSLVQLSIHAKEIIDAKLISDIIGTGPFIFSQYKTDETPELILVKNEEYYLKSSEGEQLPYLDSVRFIIENRKLEQLDLFESQKIDLIIGLPTSKIKKIVEGRLSDFNSVPPSLVLYKNPLLMTNYLFFDMTDPRFENPKVRQAFNYAFNRQKLGRDVLKNQYEDLGNYGIVPPISKIFKGYDFNSVKKVSYSYNPEKAKKLLAEAGYPEGKGFGTVNLRFHIGEINSEVADEFSQQIFQVLGINVNIDGSSFEQLNKDMEEGNGDIFKTSWIADYPNPENFLVCFLSSNQPNKLENKTGLNFSKYNSKVFDDLYNAAANENKVGKKLQLYSEAEIELMKNPPIIPLWYSGDLQLSHSYVRNMRFNPLNIFDFRHVYIKEWTAEEYQKEVLQKK